jgi:hypothetical protein
MIDTLNTWLEEYGMKHSHPLEPFKRTLELERMREVKAAADLQEALKGLVNAVNERKEHTDD